MRVKSYRNPTPTSQLQIWGSLESSHMFQRSTFSFMQELLPVPETTLILSRLTLWQFHRHHHLLTKLIPLMTLMPAGNNTKTFPLFMRKQFLWIRIQKTPKSPKTHLLHLLGSPTRCQKRKRPANLSKKWQSNFNFVQA